ncbi:MAG: sulfotransferase [Planctomycetota bacterium]|nr:sulfotransferase [Planctomycetota bacterium]
MSADQSFSFVFICQSGRLEVDALILALSLQHFVKCDYELVAALPNPASRWGTPRADILEQFERMNMRMVDIENQIDSDYPIGNKISCLSIPTDKDKQVFIDSDILCLQEFHGGEEFRAAFNAKPADVLTFGRDETIWKHAYATMDLQPPDSRVEATISGESMLPYFNAGFIAVQSDAGFGDAWRDACLAIDAEPKVEPKRPWLDQIGLPVAVHKLGLDIGLLTERHNFPGHLRAIDDADPPVFCHYHTPKLLLKSQHAISVIKQLGAEHPFIWDLMRAQEMWEPVAKLGRAPMRRRVWSMPGLKQGRNALAQAAESRHRKLTPKRELGRNGIVTGFPRSGTSLYSTLLNSIPNVTCLNEISPTDKTFRYFRQTRQKIAAGLPITNKYSGSGELTTNTISGGTQRDDRVVEIEGDDFVLAQKFTLPYLNRLVELCDQGWSVWVLVRHPLFAISSWKRCPPHFAIAKIDPPDPLLAHIGFSSEDRDERRVEIWNHYAKAIDEVRDRVQIVRYEDLVENPQRELERFCSHYDLQVPALLPELESRNRKGAYKSSEELRDLVTARCELSRFGYE